MNVYENWQIAKDVFPANYVKDKFGYMFCDPGWKPPEQGGCSITMKNISRRGWALSIRGVLNQWYDSMMQLRLYSTLILLFSNASTLAFDEIDADIDSLIEQEIYWNTAKDVLPQTIQLSITGVSNNKGKINVMIFNETDSFSQLDGLRAVGLEEVDASRGTVKLEATVTAGGPYAVFVHHDEDNDKDMDFSNGKPLEGIGYSGWIDPYRTPSFAESAIVNESSRIRLTYYRKDLRLKR